MSHETSKSDEGIKEAQNAGAHSGIRTGGSDYNDGANVTDYLGNDDQDPEVGKFDSGRPADRKEGDQKGKVANGNTENPFVTNDESIVSPAKGDDPESQVRLNEDASLQDKEYAFDEDNTGTEEYHDADSGEDAGDHAFDI